MRSGSLPRPSLTAVLLLVLVTKNTTAVSLFKARNSPPPWKRVLRHFLIRALNVEPVVVVGVFT